MFIYEKNGAICVTFRDNKPVAAPEYVIVIDEATQSVSVNGKKFIDTIEEPEVVEEPVKEVTPKKAAKSTKVEEPTKVAEPTPVEEAPIEVPAE